jgi:hypothetical protein
MTRTPALVLLLLAACSRAPAILDDAPTSSGTHGGIPMAASSARVTPGALPAADPSGEADAGGLALPGFGTHKAPRIRAGGVTTSSTALPVEVIERIVRMNFGRFRLCYENGLRTDPTLEGTVRTRFVIETDGSTGVVSDAGSDLTDTGVVACVERAFGNLSFPSPPGGAMTVTYSLSFAPPSP